MKVQNLMQFLFILVILQEKQRERMRNGEYQICDNKDSDSDISTRELLGTTRRLIYFFRYPTVQVTVKLQTETA